MSQNYYILLGLEISTLTFEDESNFCNAVRKAYRQMAAKAHPDKFPAEQQEAAAEKFNQLKDAQDTLCDQVKRAVHDKNFGINQHASYTREDGVEFFSDTHHSNGVETPQFKAFKLGIALDTAMGIDNYHKFAALEVVLANGQPAEDALLFTAITQQSVPGLYQYISPQFEALRRGFPAEIAMEVDSRDKLIALWNGGFQVKALALGVPIETAVKIYNKDKFEALEVVLKNGQPAEDAAGFTASISIGQTFWSYRIDSPQFKALKLGVEVATAMKIDSDNKFAALEVVLANGQPAEDAAEFTASIGQNYWGILVIETPQFAALKLGISVEDAMETESYEQLDCVETHLDDDYLPCLGITADDFDDELA